MRKDVKILKKTKLLYLAVTMSVQDIQREEKNGKVLRVLSRIIRIFIIA